MNEPVQVTWQRDEDGIMQPVSTGFSFEDYARMGTERHATPTTRAQRPAPLWALSDEKVRAVILARLRVVVPYAPENATLQELETLAEKRRDEQAARLLPRVNEYQRSLIEAQQRATKNGIAGLWVRLIYEVYRLGLDSATISTNMQGAISPWSIRCQLQRLNDVARKLFPDDCPPRHKTFGKKKHYRVGHHPNRKFESIPRAPKPQMPEPKLCECGCGRMARAGSRFLQGHYWKAMKNLQQPQLPKPEPRLCECNCGQLARVGKRFLKGHYWKAISNQGILRSGFCRVTKEQEMKERIKKHLAILRALARSRKGGKLPTAKWLNEHGYFYSYDVVRAAALLHTFKRAYARRTNRGRIPALNAVPVT